MVIIEYLRRRPALVLLVLLTVTFIPFLGETLFNTKGEPREAIVAVSMFQQGDFILPVSNGGDMPYKPPMLAWCIALVSFLTGGEVTEFTSRMPSAVALIVMTFVVYLIARRYTSQSKAMMSALISVTAFEVFRAGYACRVDMLLTMFIVTSLFLLYHNYLKNKQIFSVGAILLMSGAVLTKGPVGAVLPAMVAWTFYLLRGENFWRASLLTAANFLLSLVIPMLWYIAAWKQGGDDFLALMLEENVGRFTGTMSYESHLNPWYYNVITVVAGLLPYTLLLLFSLFGLKYAKPKISLSGSRFFAWVKSLREANPWILFNALVVILIFVFYCIPSSKRSVYLLPIYPSLAFFIAHYVHYLYKRTPRALKIYSGIIAAIPVLLLIVLIAIKISDLRLGKPSADMFLESFDESSVGIMGIIAIAASLVMSYFTFRAIRSLSGRVAVRRAIVTLLAIYWSFSAVYQPLALNAKSDVVIAKQLEECGFCKENPIYGWCAGEMMRYYTVNFYLGDSVINCEKQMPECGTMIIGEQDLEKWLDKYGNSYFYELVLDTNHRSCDTKQNVLIVKFGQKC